MKKIELTNAAKRKLLIALSIVLAIILVVLIVCTAYMESLLNLINKNTGDSTLSSDEYQDFLNDQMQTIDPDYTGEVINPDDVDLNTNKGPVVNAEHIINIMLIGQDRRPGEGRQRSDVMILCTINTETKELTMTSFMRDMYVVIPGYRDNKMNATYQIGGMSLLDKCMEANFGVYVDGNVEVDFDGFVDLIDLVGGVDVYLSNSEANYLNKIGYNVHAGVCHLDGLTALAHTRNRSIGNSDFSRTERQREVIEALLEKCRGMNVLQVKDLVEKALPMLTTDLTNREIFSYVMELVPLLSDLKITNQRIPADDTFSYQFVDNVGSVLMPDLEANRKLLEDCLAKYPD